MLNNIAENFQVYLTGSPLLALGAVFVLGLLVSLTPCSYPLIPITVAYIGGGSAGRTRAQGFVLSLFYVLGLALTYAALGLISALANRVFGFAANSPVVLIVVGVLFVLLGLSMMDVFTLPMPQFLAGLQPKNRGGAVGAFSVGIVSGFIAMPCSTPALLAVLAYVFHKGSPVFGFLLMFVYALGFGVLFIVIGTSAATLAGLPKSGAWMVWIKRVCGAAMIIAGVYFSSTAALSMKSGGVQGDEKFIIVNDASFIEKKIGKEPVFLVFFGSWCKTCAEETPELNRLYKKYSASGLAFYGVDINDTEAKAREFIAKNKIQYPVIYDKSREKIAEKFQVLAAPVIMIYDRRGTLLYSGGDKPGKLIRHIEAALGKGGVKKISNANGKNTGGTAGVSEPRVKPVTLTERPAPDVETVKWRDWDAAAFDDAARDGRPVLLYIAAPWNHDCRNMDDLTFAGADVSPFVNDNFVPVLVDPLRRPDVAYHYFKTMPTVAFLTPGGVVMKSFGYMDAKEFLAAARAVSDGYRGNEDEANRRAADTLADLQSRQTLPGDGEPPADAPSAADSMAAERFDGDHAGFGVAPKFPHFDILNFILLRISAVPDAGAKSMLSKSLNAAARLADPEWGGMYRGAANADWASPYYEKLLTDNTAALEIYAGAFRAFGDPAARDVMVDTYSYIEKYLSPADGKGFYAAQFADVYFNKKLIPGKAFYALDGKERSEIGMPARDRTLYTHENAAAVSAYLKLSGAFGWDHARKRALDTLELLWSNAYQPARGVRRIIDDAAAGPDALADQAAVLRALLDAYEATGDSVHLYRAVTLSNDIGARFTRDGKTGYTLLPVDADARGYLKIDARPLADNARLAECFMRLYHYTGKSEYRDRASRALAAFRNSWRDAPLPAAAAYARAVALFHSHPLEITVLGKKSDERYRALLDAALAFYEPNKIILPLDPAADAERLASLPYEPQPQPTIFACVTDKACARPIKEPGQVNEKLGLFVDRFMKTGGGGPALNSGAGKL